MWTRGPAMLGGAGDPLAANRTLLLHGDGADGSTTFLDSSLLGLAGARTGNPEIKTDGGAFGGASMRYYQGNTSCVEYSHPSQFFSGNTWTIEAIVELVDLSTSNNAGNNYNTILSMRSGATRTLLIGAGDTNFNFFGVLLGTISAGSRYYLAASSSPAGLRCYINGSRVYTASQINLSGYDIGIVGCVNGVNPGSSLWSHGAKIEEVRFTDGLALYSGESYALQIAAFPNP